MKKLLVGLAIMPFLVGVALAGQPMPLSEAQMDEVTGGSICVGPTAHGMCVDENFNFIVPLPGGGVCIGVECPTPPLQPFNTVLDVHFMVHFEYPGPPIYTQR